MCFETTINITFILISCLSRTFEVHSVCISETVMSVCPSVSVRVPQSDDVIPFLVYCTFGLRNSLCCDEHEVQLDTTLPALKFFLTLLS